MRRFRYCISSLIIAFLLTSCSSAIHRVGFSGPGIVGPRGTGIGYESIYIGARKNAEALYKDPLSLLVVLIDFPFSATLDTVMFPIDVVVGTYSLGARADRERPPVALQGHATTSAGKMARRDSRVTVTWPGNGNSPRRS